VTKGTSWLVTGGTGSFGRAFVGRLLSGGASRIVVYSRDELKQAEMAQMFGDERLRFFIGSVTDRQRLDTALRGVDYVVHAAAMKRVEVCEQNPSEAVQTNVIGTGVVAHAVVQAGVKRAVFLSTDKAVHPNTLYGTTKLAAERLWTRANVYAAGTATRLAATRYGNVLGSRGSVLGLWREQARLGGPLTVTDPGMSRFWMQLGEAIELVLLAFREMRGGEVFVPKLPSCDIVTLAETIAPGVPYHVTGVRRGEKLHETLISEDEARHTFDHGDHYRIEPDRTWETEPAADIAAPGVPAGWSYRSDTNEDRLDVARLRELVA
jgi:UDP-N-acetylglucosamine 4,6-dehydratase